MRVAGKLLELQQHGLQRCGVQPVQCGGHLVYGGLLFGSHRGHDLSGRCVGIHGHIAGNGFVHRALNHACRIHLGGRALSRSGGLRNDGVHFVRCHFSAVHIGLQRGCQRGGNILRGCGCNALRRGRCCLRNGCVRSLQCAALYSVAHALGGGFRRTLCSAVKHLAHTCAELLFQRVHIGQLHMAELVCQRVHLLLQGCLLRGGPLQSGYESAVQPAGQLLCAAVQLLCAIRQLLCAVVQAFCTVQQVLRAALHLLRAAESIVQAGVEGWRSWRRIRPFCPAACP